MEKLKIKVNPKRTVELHFGSWVMGQLAKRGWGYDLQAILTEIAKNPFESMATLLYLGMCSAQKKSISLDEISFDECFDLLDEISKNDDDEAMKIRDSFLISAFGDKVLEALKKLNDDDLEDSESKPKKKVTRQRGK